MKSYFPRNVIGAVREWFGAETRENGFAQTVISKAEQL